ncbi:hypothetical protein DLM75_15785 [Leptospira stimsonii]|uniref:Uncharacterized protein n=1 Tax=Leptospira stimsonii TaxID=2202203 RepID=A0A396Z194_9LEPT|nr:hypothetical protein DLM75_15785 [Leptospira stimsonii]
MKKNPCKCFPEKRYRIEFLQNKNVFQNRTLDILSFPLFFSSSPLGFVKKIPRRIKIKSRILPIRTGRISK